MLTQRKQFTRRVGNFVIGIRRILAVPRWYLGGAALAAAIALAAHFVFELWHERLLWSIEQKVWSTEQKVSELSSWMHTNAAVNAPNSDQTQNGKSTAQGNSSAP